MTHPVPSFDFDPHTLRDQGFKARFDSLWSRIEALRRDGSFVVLASHRELLDQLETVYQENLELYTKHYQGNKDRWKKLRETVALNKHQVYIDDYQAMLESLDSAEALLLAHDYQQNALSMSALDAVEDRLNNAMNRKEAIALALGTYRQDLKKAMEVVWAEDYAELKKAYQQVKNSPNPITQDLQLDAEKVAVLADKRSAKIDKATGHFVKNKQALTSINSFVGGYAYERDFDHLLSQLKKKASRKKMLVWGLGLLVVLVAGLLIWKAPEYISKSQAAADYEKAKNLDNWQAYASFINEYPNSEWANKARERQFLLDYGEITALVLPTGDTIRYEGSLDAGQPDGLGKGWFLNGTIYDGTWRAGHEEGQGTLLFPDGSEYVGTFDNNRFDKGIWRYANGSEYSGKWENGKLEGEGFATWPDGSRYSGNWKKGKFDGYGTLKVGRNISKYVSQLNLSEGSSYAGDWKGGTRNGTGSMTYADGKTYVGKWLGGKPHGRPGTLKWPDGSSFRGEWKNGEIHGEGTFVDRFGNDFKGIWQGSEDKISRKLPSSNKIENGKFEKGKYIRS